MDYTLYHSDYVFFFLSSGPFLLTNLLIPKLRENAPSRIINVSSIAHKRARINFKDLNAVDNYEKDDRYHMTKLANILFTRELAGVLEGEY